MKLSGLISATYTPFDLATGEVNADLIGPMVDFMISSGSDGFYVCGSTGEGESLSVAERKRIASKTVKHTAGRVPVIVQVGHNSVAASRELAAHAAEIGAAAISTLPPTYFKPANIDDLVKFITEVTREAPDLPYYYYHIPRLSGTAFDMADFLEKASAQIPTLNGIKFSDFYLADMMSCQEVETGRFDILFGSDEMLLGALACGAKGAVGSCYTFAAPLWKNIIASHEAGQSEEALAWMRKAARLVRVIAATGNFHACVKQVIWPLLGFEPGPLRTPQGQFTPEQIDSARKSLDLEGFAEEIATGRFELL